MQDARESLKTFESLMQGVQKFCEEREWDQFHGAKDLAIGLVTEGSELLELFRFKSPAEVETDLRTPRVREQIGDELADVLFFLLRFAQKYEFDLSAELNRKMRKNAEKYPVEKFRGSNKKYSKE